MLLSEKKSPIGIYKELNDSIYLARITDIEQINGDYFLVDIKQHTIFQLDSCLNYIGIIGEKGRGPGDFLYPLNIFGSPKRVTIIDAGNRRFSNYQQNGSHLTFESIAPLPSVIRDHKALCIKNNTIYKASLGGDYPLCKIDFVLKDTVHFGKFYEKIPMEERNFRRICVNDKCLFSFGVSEPIIDIYTLSGNLIDHFDLSDNSIFETTLKIHDDIYKKNHSGTVPTLLEDVSVVGSTIYMLIWEKNKDTLKTNKLLIFNYSDNILKLTRNLELGDGPYSAFCISPDSKSLIAFNSYLSELHEFKLN
jgi:hypothetical protein